MLPRDFFFHYVPFHHTIHSLSCVDSLFAYPRHRFKMGEHDIERARHASTPSHPNTPGDKAAAEMVENTAVTLTEEDVRLPNVMARNKDSDMFLRTNGSRGRPTESSWRF